MLKKDPWTRSSKTTRSTCSSTTTRQVGEPCYIYGGGAALIPKDEGPCGRNREMTENYHMRRQADREVVS